MTPRGSAAASFHSNVFVNCPFDTEYRSLLRPLLFTIADVGFRPRISSERSESTENRVDKIVEFIQTSRLSIHDISRFRATAEGEFARFNLPFELGLAHGSRLFGPKRMQSKCCLILDKEQHEFRRALSDLSGVDIKNHNDEASELVRAVRNWFVETVGLTRLRSPTVIWYRFNDFISDLHDRCKTEGFSDDDIATMPIPEYLDAIGLWRDTHP